MTITKKARWQAGLKEHFGSHLKRIALLLLLAASTGAGVALLTVAVVHWIGGGA